MEKKYEVTLYYRKPLSNRSQLELEYDAYHLLGETIDYGVINELSRETRYSFSFPTAEAVETFLTHAEQVSPRYERCKVIESVVKWSGADITRAFEESVRI